MERLMMELELISTLPDTARLAAKTRMYVEMRDFEKARKEIAYYSSICRKECARLEMLLDMVVAA